MGDWIGVPIWPGQIWRSGRGSGGRRRQRAQWPGADRADSGARGWRDTERGVARRSATVGPTMGRVNTVPSWADGYRRGPASHVAWGQQDLEPGGGVRSDH